AVTEIEYQRTIAEMLQNIIAFAKGAGYQLKTYSQKTGADAIGLDWSVPMAFAAELQKEGPVQGNLDPMRVVAGGRALEEG
ncbi:uroporphyrinogen decarboxylase family protein, partial [Rhizobium johnstonii]